MERKPFGLAAEEKMEGAAIITWQRKRCDKPEEVNHCLKEKLAEGHVLSIASFRPCRYQQPPLQFGLLSPWSGQFLLLAAGRSSSPRWANQKESP